MAQMLLISVLKRLKLWGKCIKIVGKDDMSGCYDWLNYFGMKSIRVFSIGLHLSVEALSEDIP